MRVMRRSPPSAPSPNELDDARAALVGLGVVLFALTGLVVAFVVQLRQPWSRIAVRVLGSWIAASGLLMLGWAMRATR
jgi:hypothetical protein